MCNLVAGGVGRTLTAGTHVIFQDLDWVPANHRQAEDRAYRLGQTERVTVESMLADGMLDEFIAKLLEAKLRLIGAVEGDVPPDTSVLDECPSSDDLRQFACFRKGGSGSSVIEIMRRAVDAASGGLRLSGV